MQCDVTDNSIRKFEYEIPRTDAEEIVRNHVRRPLLEKTHHYILTNWYVDVYEGMFCGIVLAGIELVHKIGARSTDSARLPKDSDAFASLGNGASLAAQTITVKKRQLEEERI